jgi:hypothetical protein
VGRTVETSAVIKINQGGSRLIEEDEGEGSTRRHEDTKKGKGAEVGSGSGRLACGAKLRTTLLSSVPHMQSRCADRGAVRADQGGSRLRQDPAAATLPLAPRERMWSAGRSDAGQAGTTAGETPRAPHALASAHSDSGLGDQRSSRWPAGCHLRPFRKRRGSGVVGCRRLGLARRHQPPPRSDGPEPDGQERAASTAASDSPERHQPPLVPYTAASALRARYRETCRSAPVSKNASAWRRF